jgi:hypothetical protein
MKDNASIVMEKTPGGRGGCLPPVMNTFTVSKSARD